jgi:MFS family permease
MIAALFAPKPLGFWLLLGGAILYFVSVHFTVPAWMSVMGDLVPPASRGRYFGWRNAIALLLQLLSATTAGVGLWIYEKAGHEAQGFLVLFVGSLLARGVSTYYLWRMAEPPYSQREEDRFTFLQFLRRLPHSNFAKFALFVACLNAASHFVGCLFIPYWRNDLRYSYWELMAVMAAVLVIQIPSLVFWGRVADRYGNKRVLKATSLGIAVLPAMWLVSGNLAFALFMQFWSGFWWSGFSQSVSNFLLDAVTPAKRARCTAYLNLISNSGILAGGLAGSWAIGVVPARIGPVDLPFAFSTLLVLSTVLRSSVVLIFMPLIREVRDVPKVGTVEMLFHATREAAESAVNLLAGVGRGPGEDEPSAAPK